MTFKVKSGIRVNTIDVIDQYGNFTGNSYLGTVPVAINRGGTGSNTAPGARINLFTDQGVGFAVKVANGEVITRTVTAGTGVVIDNADGELGNLSISIGQNVSTTADVTFANITVNGVLISDDITATTVTTSGDLTVLGNLIVQGNTTTLNTETLAVEDNQIILNSSLDSGTAPSLDADIIVNRGSGANVSLRWDETTDDRWKFTNDGTNYYVIPEPDEYDNTVYDVSVEVGPATQNANLVLTGTNQVTSATTVDKVKFVGAGLVTVTATDANTITINAGGSLSNKITGITDSAATTIDYFDLTVHRAAEYFYTVETASHYTSGKIMVLHNGSSTWQTQYAMLQTNDNDELVTFQTDINAGNVRLLAQATSGNTANVSLTNTHKALI
jgi:hypothetical protein